MPLHKAGELWGATTTQTIATLFADGDASCSGGSSHLRSLEAATLPAGSATSSNVTWEHLLNYTWVSYPIPSIQPSDLELFGSIMYED